MKRFLKNPEISDDIPPYPALGLSIVRDRGRQAGIMNDDTD